MNRINSTNEVRSFGEECVNRAFDSLGVLKEDF